MPNAFLSASDRLEESVVKLVAFANAPVQSVAAEVPEDVLTLIAEHPGPLVYCAYNHLSDPQAQRRLLYAQHVVSKEKTRERYSGTRAQKTFATFKWVCGLDTAPRHKSLGDAEDDRLFIRFIAVLTAFPICTLALCVALAIINHR